MTRQLGPHFMTGGTGLAGWAAESAVLKLAGDFPRVTTRPGALVIGRVIDERGWTLGQGDPGSSAAWYFDHVVGPALDRNPHVAAWEGPNEPIFTDGERMRWYGAFLYEFARLVAARGRRAVIGNWAVGWPLADPGTRQVPLWWHYQHALRAVRDHGALLGRHGYGPLDDFYALRHRLDNEHFAALGFPDLPVVITECGCDDAGGYRPWREYYGSAADYWREWCQPFADKLAADRYVIGAALFTLGTGSADAWRAFDVAGTEIPEWAADLCRAPEQEHEPMPIVVIDTPDPVLRGQVLDHIIALQADADRRGQVYPYGPPAPAPPAAPWWETLPLPGKALSIAGVTRRFRAPDLTAIQIDAVPDTRKMDVWERQGEWLRVYPPLGVAAAQQWVLAGECQPAG